MKIKILTILFVASFSFLATNVCAQNYNEQAAQLGRLLGKQLAKKIIGTSPNVLEGNVEGMFYRTDDDHIGFFAQNDSKYNFDITVQFYRPSTNTREYVKVKLTANNNIEYHPKDFSSDWVFKARDVISFSIPNGFGLSWTCPEDDRYYREQAKRSQQRTVITGGPEVRSVTKPCGVCNGSKKCNQCNGTGLKTYWVSTGQRVQSCGGCGGTGSCQPCFGTGVIHTSEYR